MASTTNTTTPATTAPTTAPASPKAIATHADFEDDEGPMEIGSDETDSEPEDSDDDDEWEETSDDDGDDEEDDDEDDDDSDESASDGYANSIGLSTYAHPHTHADSDSDYYTTSHPPSHIRRASNTTTLFSSVQHYEFENGRRYHSYRSGIYILPNDELECERLDLSYALSGRLLDGRLLWGPLPASLASLHSSDSESSKVVEGGSAVMGEERMRVLDVGTGTGIWAIDFADLYPGVEVIATDLSPIQPTSIPANLSFEVDDAGSEWTYPDNHFDLIHIRNIAGSITDWPLLLTQAHRCLKPHGTLHLSESHAPLPSFPPSSTSFPHLQALTQSFLTLSRSAGLLYHNLPSLAQSLTSTGFKDVQSERAWIPFPSSTAPPPTAADTKTTTHTDPLLTKLTAIQILKLAGLEAFTLRLFTQTEEHTAEDVLKLCEAAKAEVTAAAAASGAGSGKDGEEEEEEEKEEKEEKEGGVGTEVWFFWGRKGRGGVGGLEGIVE